MKHFPDTILFETAPKIIVEKISPVSATGYKKNPNGVGYNYTNSAETLSKVTFYPADFAISITPFLHDGDGYSDQKLIDEVIKSFKLVEEGIIIVKSKETGIYKDLAISVEGTGHLLLSDKTEESVANVVFKIGNKEIEKMVSEPSKDKNGILAYDSFEIGEYVIFAQDVGLDGSYVKFLIKKQI